MITSLANLIVGWRQTSAAFDTSAAALLSAEASLKNAETTAKTAIDTAQLRREELKRSTILDLCRTQTEDLRQLRSDLAELASIAYATNEMTPKPLDSQRACRAILLAARLQLTILPNKPIGETLQLDFGRVHGELIQNSKTIADSALWSRFYLNSMRFIFEEQHRIEQQMLTGELVEKRNIKPQLSFKTSLELYEKNR